MAGTCVEDKRVSQVLNIWDLAIIYIAAHLERKLLRRSITNFQFHNFDLAENMSLLMTFWPLKRQFMDSYQLLGENLLSLYPKT